MESPDTDNTYIEYLKEDNAISEKYFQASVNYFYAHSLRIHEPLQGEYSKTMKS